MAGPVPQPGRSNDAGSNRVTDCTPPGPLRAATGSRPARGPMRIHLTNRDRYRIRAALVVTFLALLVWAGSAGYLCDLPPGYCQ